MRRKEGTLRHMNKKPHMDDEETHDTCTDPHTADDEERHEAHTRHIPHTAEDEEGKP